MRFIFLVCIVNMTKTIQLNPEFLGGSSKNIAAKTRKKEKPVSSVQPNKLRNELLKKIKDYQANNNNNSNNDNNNNDSNKNEVIEDFNDEFNKSLHFLQDLTNKKNGVRSKTRKTNKSYDVAIELPDEMIEKTSETDNSPSIIPVASVSNISTAAQVQTPFVSTAAQVQTPFVSTAAQVQTPFVSTVLTQTNNEVISSPLIVSPTPVERTMSTVAYSSIKNGSKPTYRELKRPIAIEDKPNYIETNNHKMLEKIKEDYKKANAVAGASVTGQSASVTGKSASVTGKSASVAVKSASVAVKSASVGVNYVQEPSNKNFKKIRKTIRRTKYRLGKLGNKVSVLIKDYKTRKNIQDECYKLEKTSIFDIKNFLRKKNLLKIGSVAEEDVLREMYEQCILAGDIQNKNKDTLIHNYLTKV